VSAAIDLPVAKTSEVMFKARPLFAANVLVGFWAGANPSQAVAAFSCE
jgi:hypothetical protein